MAVIAERLGRLDAGVPPWREADTRAASRATFSLVTDCAGLDALRAEWTTLFETSGRPQQVFQSFEWLATWASVYGGDSAKLSVVTGRVDGHLVLVWPLVIQRISGLRILSFLGEPVSQYGDAIVADDIDEATADAAFDYVSALPVDVIALRRVRDDAGIAPLLRRRVGIATNRQAAPVIDLSGVTGVAAFETRFDGKLRSSRRRRRRRLEERGAVSFTTYGPSDEATILVGQALDFKRDWAQRTGVISPALRDPRFARFFAAAALAGPRAPALRVGALRSGGDVVGIEISVACKGHLFGHVLAPRPDLPQLGLGGVLAESMVTAAIAEGAVAVDLLAPADPYKLEWTTKTVGVGDYVVARTLLGRLYAQLWLGFGRDAMKTAALRLQPYLARRRAR